VFTEGEGSGMASKQTTIASINDGDAAQSRPARIVVGRQNLQRAPLDRKGTWPPVKPKDEAVQWLTSKKVTDEPSAATPRHLSEREKP
jgi:hypothetical protein